MSGKHDRRKAEIDRNLWRQWEWANGDFRSPDPARFHVARNGATCWLVYACPEDPSMLFGRPSIGAGLEQRSAPFIGRIEGSYDQGCTVHDSTGKAIDFFRPWDWIPRKLEELCRR